MVFQSQVLFMILLRGLKDGPPAFGAVRDGIETQAWCCVVIYCQRSGFLSQSADL